MSSEVVEAVTSALFTVASASLPLPSPSSSLEHCDGSCEHSPHLPSRQADFASLEGQVHRSCRGRSRGLARTGARTAGARTRRSSRPFEPPGSSPSSRRSSSCRHRRRRRSTPASSRGPQRKRAHREPEQVESSSSPRRRSEVISSPLAPGRRRAEPAVAFFFRGRYGGAVQASERRAQCRPIGRSPRRDSLWAVGSWMASLEREGKTTMLIALLAFSSVSSRDSAP